MKQLLVCIIAALIITGCSKSKEKIPPVTSMERSSGKMVVYQVMTRLFGNKTSVNERYGTIERNGVGKFNDIDEAALRGIKELGTTHVWYTGIIEHAVLTDYTKFGIPLDDADVVKGRAGSPYAIKDYYDVDPDLAVDVSRRMKEFEALVGRTQEQGLKVIIDFVPNHVARAYKSDAKPNGIQDLGQLDDSSVPFKPNNNFYYLPGQSFQVPEGYESLGNNAFPTKDGKFAETPAKVTGNDQFTARPGVNEWFETVKLNYGVDIRNGRRTYFDPIPDTWLKMKDILVFWAEKNIDGFRCDMAEMVPVEFWGWVIPKVKAVNPDIIFVAEIYNSAQYHNYIQSGKFDFLYDKVQLYDTLRFLLDGRRSTKDIGLIRQSLADINQHMLHFLENHDEQRIASRFFAGSPWKAVPAMVVSATIDRGPVMIYFGQETGEAGLGDEGFQTDDGRTTIFDYWGVPEHQKWMNGGKFDGGLLSDDQKQLRQFYIDLLTLASQTRAIYAGEYIDITEANIMAGNFDEQFCAYIRYSGDEIVIVVSSFKATEEQVKIQIPKDVANKLNLNTSSETAEQTSRYTARDLLWKDLTVDLSDDFILETVIKPYGALILKLEKP